MYNETVLDHFNNPRNVGKIEDGVIGEVSSPGCGDTTFIYLDIEDGVIKDIKFKTFGCAAAIASSSMLTTMVKGMSLEDAKKITNADIVKQLGGLPEVKINCSVLAAEDVYKRQALEKRLCRRSIMSNLSPLGGVTVSII